MAEAAATPVKIQFVVLRIGRKPIMNPFARRSHVLVVAVCLLLSTSCAKKSAEERSLTAADSLKAMHLSEDFHVELFAAEPDVMSPVEMAFDENGKIYVAEMMDYPDDPPAGKPARSRIRLLEDTNGDGKIDRTTIFADQVLAVSGFMPWKGGLIVTSAPDILYMKDENGDGKADVRKVLYTGFPKVNHEARITNPRLASDNWIYCSNTGSNGRITSPDHPDMAPVLVRGTDFRFDPITGKAEAASGTGAVRLDHRRLRKPVYLAEHDAYPARRRSDAIPAAGAVAGGRRRRPGHLGPWTSVSSDVSSHRAAGVAQAAHEDPAAAL